MVDEEEKVGDDGNDNEFGSFDPNAITFYKDKSRQLRSRQKGKENQLPVIKDHNY